MNNSICQVKRDDSELISEITKEQHSRPKWEMDEPKQPPKERYTARRGIVFDNGEAGDRCCFVCGTDTSRPHEQAIKISKHIAHALNFYDKYWGIAEENWSDSIDRIAKLDFAEKEINRLKISLAANEDTLMVYRESKVLRGMGEDRVVSRVIKEREAVEAKLKSELERSEKAEYRLERIKTEVGKLYELMNLA